MVQTTKPSFSSRSNAKRAAEKMIVDGKAPAVDYAIRPCHDGRFEIIWKATRAAPTTEEVAAEFTAATETATSGSAPEMGAEPAVTSDSEPAAADTTRTESESAEAENLFPAGTWVTVRKGKHKAIVGQVTQRIGWDEYNNMMRSWTFDSLGGIGESYWERDGNRWTAATSGILPVGGTGGATIVVEFVDQNTFVWRSLDREVDGQPLADSEIKFVRKAAK